MIRKGGDTCMGFSLKCITNINRIFRNLAKEKEYLGEFYCAKNEDGDSFVPSVLHVPTT